MIDVDIHIKAPNQKSYNTAYVKTLQLTDRRILEITVINKTYTWFKFAFSISETPFLILGLFKFVVCLKIK